MYEESVCNFWVFLDTPLSVRTSYIEALKGGAVTGQLVKNYETFVGVGLDLEKN